MNKSKIQGVRQLSFEKYSDHRGYFQTSPTSDNLKISPPIVRQSFAISNHGVRRGMHMQRRQWQTIIVVHGLILDVLLDCRPESKTFGHVDAFTLSGEEAIQIILPSGIAHGYEVLSKDSTISYGSTVDYLPKEEVVINTKSSIFSGIWEISEPLISARDSDAPLWEQVVRTIKFQA